MDEFIKELGIGEDGTISENDNYVINFDTFDDWSRANSNLERSDELDMDEEASSITEKVYLIQYVNDDYTITMKAVMESDDYSLICREN